MALLPDGSVTLTAVGRGPHKTVHYAQGYDNHVTTMAGTIRNAKGTIQLVTPTMTRWLLPGASWETGGIGILRLQFIAFDPPDDGDGIPYRQDNCQDDPNSGQDDTDGDSCGNVCDTDYNQSGLTTVADFGEFSQKFGSTDPEFCHVQGASGSVVPSTVGVDDFGVFAANFNTVPGPSGTTPGTVACPVQ